MTLRKKKMPVHSPTYQVCALLKGTRRIRPLYPGDVIRLAAEELAAASWNGLTSTRFRVEKRHDLDWVACSNQIYQSDLLGIIYVVDEDDRTAQPVDEKTRAAIAETIHLPKGTDLEEAGFDGPWDLLEIIDEEKRGRRKQPVLFVREPRG